MRGTKYTVTYPVRPTGTIAVTTRATDPHTAISNARRAGFTAPVGRSVDLNAEPEVRAIGRDGSRHVYGPRYAC